MNDQEFKAKLTDLLDQLNELPPAERQRLEQLAEETQQRHDRMKKTLGDLQESLDYLRLSVKYLVFDLEATRRENHYLRNLLQTGENDAAEDRED